MTMYSCNECGVEFADNEDLAVHMDEIHGMELAEDDSSQTSTESRSTEDCDDGSDDKIEEDDSHTDEKIWEKVMQEVLDEDGSPDLQKPNGKYNTKKLVKAIREYVNDLIEFADDIGTTDIHEAITAEKDRLEELGYEEQEAIQVAWQNRRYLLKQKVIHPYLEKVPAQSEDDE
jgi:hypothetical protein